VTASLAIQSAQASVVAAQQQASATRVAAMNETVLALTITFSVLGSSLISILIYYLISRYRRQRRERKQSELKEKIHRLRHESDGSMAPSLSAFPMPVGRKSWLSRSRPDTVETAQVTGTETGMLSGSPTLLNSGPLPGSATRQTWAPSREGRERRGNRSQGDIDFGFGGSNSSPKETRKTWAAREMIPEERPGMVRKNTLTYDPEHPERPPKFTTWLEDSFRSVSPFPDMEDEKFAGMAKRRSSYLGNGPNWQKKQSLIQRRRSKSMGEISDIGTAI
jgi:membrane protein implicated in regulation of membrane protease activity